MTTNIPTKKPTASVKAKAREPHKPLTDAQCRNAKPKDTIFRLYDSLGLYLEVHPNGGRYWRLKFRHGGKEKRLSLGVYPVVPLASRKDMNGKIVIGAREKRDDARKALLQGLDPGAARRSDAFEAVAREAVAKKYADADAETVKRVTRWLEGDAFPWIGRRPIGMLTAPEILQVVERVEKRGAVESAHRVLAAISMTFRYAIARGYVVGDPCSALKGALKQPKRRNFASVKEPIKVGRLLISCDEYKGSFIVRCALRLLPLVFTRPSELRLARWGEFDLKGRAWRIPANRMKGRRLHIVPLSDQVVAILKELMPLTGLVADGKLDPEALLFPGVRSRDRSISENTLNAALRTMGYAADEATGHGFRHTASTLLNESQQFSPDAIELQLAHSDENKVRAVYNAAELMPERKKMMQWWADYLDSLRTLARAEGAQ